MTKTRKDSDSDHLFEGLPNKIMTAMSACRFYKKLSREGRRPEYFGHEIKPGDADSVLMRWRLENGKIRVIFGDLKTQTK